MTEKSLIKADVFLKMRQKNQVMSPDDSDNNGNT
jgi:hypothetical protein